MYLALWLGYLGLQPLTKHREKRRTVKSLSAVIVYRFNS